MRWLSTEFDETAFSFESNYFNEEGDLEFANNVGEERRETGRL